ncbi:MAG: SAM-dependent methyltransferase, partial [Gammaproteobacteria bacterium]|nr:SAM-dependent methyltransferase [Gammaproteobacteria bacterium]
SAGAAGLHALQENYLYTSQALTDYLRHLSEDGLLSLTRWYESPPRDSLRLIATALVALDAMGIDQPGQHLLVLRSWQTVTVIIARQAYTPGQLATIRQFCRRHGFDLAYAPDIRAEEVNRFNRSHQPFLYQGVQAMLSGRFAAWQDNYPFDISPVSDERPYFFHHFRWAYLDRLLEQAAGLGKAQLEWGYLVLWLTLLVAVAGSFLLIMLPLWFGLRIRATGEQDDKTSRFRLFVYFSGLGLGFMFIEIAFIQYFILLLGHPLYSISIVLTSFLVFAGVGSFFARRWLQSGLSRVLLAIVLMLPLYLLLLPLIFNLSLGWSEPMRLALAVLLIAPLAFLMGVPFPIGLAKLSEIAPAFSPWAWGINGCASVTAVILAKLLAMALGFSVVLVCAMLVYALAAWSIPRARSVSDA